MATLALFRDVKPRPGKSHIQLPHVMNPDPAVLRYRSMIQDIRSEMRVIEDARVPYLTNAYWLALQARLNVIIQEAKIVLPGSSEPIVE